MTPAIALDAPETAHEEKTRQAPAELFSQSSSRRMRALASAHVLSNDPRRSPPLIPHIDDAGRHLDEAYRFLTTAARTAQAVPSEDWLRDNHYIVQDQVRAIRQDLPRSYYFELPKLAGGPLAGYPRVLALARELVVHTAGRLDLQTLIAYVGAYQRVAPLSIGEVWAVPIMLRIALVDELRRLADNVVSASRDREEARPWGLRFSQSTTDAATTIDASLRAAKRQGGRLSDAFVVELLQWLRDQPASAAPAWEALQRALQEQNDSPEAMLRREHTRPLEIVRCVHVHEDDPRVAKSRDLILGDLDHAHALEEVDDLEPSGDESFGDVRQAGLVVDGVHGLEPAADSRDHDVPLTRSRDDELDHGGMQERQHHVGYFLISHGRFLLEQAAGYPPKMRERFARFVFWHPALGYLGTIAGLTALTLASLLSYAARHGASGWGLWIVALVALLPVSELTIGLLNLLLTNQVPPRRLPKLDLRGGIPERDRTFVVIPVIVDREAQLASLLEDLEVRFFGNPIHICISRC